jgi:hypothetical protein
MTHIATGGKDLAGNNPTDFRERRLSEVDRPAKPAALHGRRRKLPG